MTPPESAKERERGRWEEGRERWEAGRDRRSDSDTGRKTDRRREWVNKRAERFRV
jgi:hypothetical protein